MGGTFSDPVPPLINQGYICFILRSYDKLRVLHAPPEVHQTIVAIVR